MAQIKFKLLRDSAKLPTYAHEGDAGFDIYAAEEMILKKGHYLGVSTGIASEISEGFFVSIRDRSGTAFRNGLHTLAGVIDCGYRGEWFVVLVNLGQEDYQIEVGDRIAQGILQRYEAAEIVEADEISDSLRGEKGLGSTGRK